MSDIEHVPSDNSNAEGPAPAPPPEAIPPAPRAALPPEPVALDPIAAEDAAAEEGIAPPRPDPLATGIAILVMASLLVCAIIVLIAAVNA